MSVIGSNILAGASGQGGEYTIEESLRFNASQSSYLSWTPASAGNRKTWTFSAWVKRGQLGTSQNIFSVGTTGPIGNLIFDTTGQLRFYTSDSAVSTSEYQLTTAVFRDPSAWYHIVCAIDTTQATYANRVKLYVNGVLQSVTVTNQNTQITQNANLGVNRADAHNIGRLAYNASGYLDGYLTEVNFIDGQALDPSSFGEFDSVTGVWKPAKYTGTYGTNGFYLPMQLDNTVEGFNTVTYIGTQKPQKISGVGFSPDLVWIKSRNNAQNHTLYDSVRGATKYLMSNSTNAEATDAQTLTSFDTDGFSMGTSFPNDLNYTYVAWCWDAGSSTVSNTDGSITSSVRANPTYGFSVVTYTGTGANATVGHGLGVAPSMVIVKDRSNVEQWAVYHKNLTSANYVLYLDSTAAQSIGASWNSTNPTSSVVSLGGGSVTNQSGHTYVAYCFSEVAGFSKFGSYAGTGASGNTVTTGFKPAMVILKRSTGAEHWQLFDNTRSVGPEIQKVLYPNLSDSEYTWGSAPIKFTDTGFELLNSDVAMNGGSDTYIYMAFKDTREYAYWLDDSGNNNDWQPNGGITTESTVTDTPTPYADGGNYCTLNPLSNLSVTLSEGNLKGLTILNNADTRCNSTIAVSSGKWYFETYLGVAGTNTAVGIGQNQITNQYPAKDALSFAQEIDNARKGNNNTFTAYGTALVAGDIFMCAFDLENNKIFFGKNGTWFNSSNPETGTSPAFTLTAGLYTPIFRPYGNTSGYIQANFGQRPFAYTPPTGFKPLHTGNLPDSAIVDGSQYFNAVTWVGDGAASKTITSLQFQPDLVWIKRRDASGDHGLYDVLRSREQLRSNTTDAGVTAPTDKDLISINSNGHTWGLANFLASNGLNVSNVVWNWKANGSGVSNTDGSITSTVSANPTAGFSVVTHTGTGGIGTIGHGLGVAPAMFISKNRVNGATNWHVYHQSVGNTKALFLNTTEAPITSVNYFNNTSPTDTVFTLASAINLANTYVTYCFAEVEGYSKFGSYTGNGSADGPFVYLGFKPRFILFKKTSAADDWVIYDTARDEYNVASKNLFPNGSFAEDSNTTNRAADILSNGFKLRSSGSFLNGSGATFIFAAFAENPFKNSLAR